MATARDTAHQWIDDAVAEVKKSAIASDRFDRLDSHVATVHMVIDEIAVADPVSQVAPADTVLPGTDPLIVPTV